MTRTGVFLIVLALALAAFVLVNGALPAQAADMPNGMRSDRFMGFFGEGHEENHQHYMGLKNANNGSCCNGADCRPTQARWIGSEWEFMVDGRWRKLPLGESYRVLTPEVFAKQGRERWDGQAHVCTTVNGAKVYCLIPPASGG